MDRENDIPFVYEDGVMKPSDPLRVPNGWRGIARIRSRDEGDPFDAPPNSSWKNRTIDDLAREQGITGPTNLDDLRGDWPPEDSIDEFLAELRKGRR